MTPKAPVLEADFSNLGDVLQVLPIAPQKQSNSADWENITLQQYDNAPAWDTPVHTTQQHLLTITTEPNKTIERRMGEIRRADPAQVGDVIVMPASVEHWCAWSQSTTSFLVLTIDPAFLAHAAYEIAEPDRTELIPTFAKSDPFVYGTGLALQAALEKDGSAASRLYAESLSQSLAVHLLKNYATRPVTVREYEDGLSRYQLKQAIAYIHAHLDQTIKLADIAQLLGMSQYYFCRQFRDSMGIPPYQYVIKQRVERAKQLLRKDRSRAIADIALDCGFNSQSHLAKHFRQITGTTAKAYRRTSS